MDLTSETRLKAQSGSGWYEALARVGLTAKGISFGLVGALALKLALGAGGKATSRQGALRDVAQQPFGKVLLVALAAGFAAYALWRLIEGCTLREENEKKAWGKRALALGRAAIYGTLTFSTLKIVLGAGGQSQNREAHKTTATVFSWPGGTWIVGIIGAVIVGVGCAQLYRALTRDFEKRWRGAKMSSAARRWGRRLGVAGHVSRGVVFGLIGIFVIKAALDYNPRDAIGLDGALQKLAQASYGPYLLGLTAAGLICYALYCFVDARYRDVSA